MGLFFRSMLAVALLMVGQSFAIADVQDLKVLDQRGLTRAVKRVNGPVRVTIGLKGGADSGLAVRLVNLDGLSPDISGSVAGPSVQFEGVKSGTWQIKGGVAIASVEIVP